MKEDFKAFLSGFNRFYEESQTNPTEQADEKLEQALSLIDAGGLFAKEFSSLIDEAKVSKRYDQILEFLAKEFKRHEAVDVFLDKGLVFSRNKEGYIKKTELPHFTKLFSIIFTVDEEIKPIISLYFSKFNNHKNLALFYHFSRE